MGGRPSWTKWHVKQRIAAADLTTAERERCRGIVEAWNVEPTHQWSPAIGTAIAAGYPWLSVHCPGCGTISDVDLRALDRHPHTAITGLIPALSCRRCRPHAPFAELVGLARLPHRFPLTGAGTL